MQRIIIIFLLLAACKGGPEETGGENLALTLLLSSPESVCPESTPFSALAGAGATTGCGGAGCHNQTDLAGGMDISDYNSVLNKVIPGDPENSVLYITVITGTMMDYTTPVINSAVYCWIKNGALP